MTRTPDAPTARELDAEALKRVGGGLPQPDPEWKYVPVRR